MAHPLSDGPLPFKQIMDVGIEWCAATRLDGHSGTGCRVHGWRLVAAMLMSNHSCGEGSPADGPFCA